MPASQILAFPAPVPKAEKPSARKRSPSSDPALPAVSLDSAYPSDAALATMRKLRVPRLKKISKSLF